MRRLLTILFLLCTAPAWALPPICSVLTSNMDIADAASYTTASVTPTANHLILVLSESRINTGVSGGPQQVTVTGNSLTYVQVSTQVSAGATPNRRISVHRAMGSSPSSGTIGLDYNSETQTHSSWIVLDCANVPTTGTNGSGAVAQSATANDGGPGGTTATVSLASAPSPDTNLTIGYGLNTGPATITAGSGYTSLSTVSESESGTYAMAEYKTAAQTADMSWTGVNAWTIAAVDLVTLDSGCDRMLQEDGYQLVLEDGASYVLLESSTCGAVTAVPVRMLMGVGL